MKLAGRIVAILITAAISVLAVQHLIKRLYYRYGKRYISLEQSESAPITGEDGAAQIPHPRWRSR